LRDIFDEKCTLSGGKYSMGDDSRVTWSLAFRHFLTFKLLRRWKRWNCFITQGCQTHRLQNSRSRTFRDFKFEKFETCFPYFYADIKLRHLAGLYGCAYQRVLASPNNFQETWHSLLNFAMNMISS
jgi:hypothetical protein